MMKKYLWSFALSAIVLVKKRSHRHPWQRPPRW